MVSERATKSLVFAGVLGAIGAVASIGDIVTHISVLALIGLVALIVALVFFVEAYMAIFMVDRHGRQLRHVMRILEQAKEETSGE